GALQTERRADRVLAIRARSERVGALKYRRQGDGQAPPTESVRQGSPRATWPEGARSRAYDCQSRCCRSDPTRAVARRRPTQGGSLAPVRRLTAVGPVAGGRARSRARPTCFRGAA